MALSPEALGAIGTVVGGAAGWIIKHVMTSGEDKKEHQGVNINMNETPVPNKFCGQAHVDLCVAVVEIKSDVKTIGKSQERMQDHYNNIEHQLNETKHGVQSMVFQMKEIKDSLKKYHGVATV